MADKTDTVQIELIHAASPSRVWRQTLRLPAGSSIADALRLSEFAQACPELSLAALQVGVYGQSCSSDRIVAEGDRIEIYRPLRFDPMESRRRRAEHRRRKQQQPRKGTPT